MRAVVTILLACLGALLVGGCGGPDDSTPVACLEGSKAYLRALAEAPGDVRLAGETPISDCLAENQKAGDLASVGETLIEAATELNAGARDEPGGEANLQLGYLLGAAQRGADRTQGIHTDLLRRLAVAARYSREGPPPARFMVTYRKGFAAGRARG
jgi:hypothetical protein